MRITTDQLHRKMKLTDSPARIISLVPSQTELLYDLGLRNEVVGITKFCVHPEEWFRSKTRIGGTKNLNIDKIKALQPDFILANKEENKEDEINLLLKEFPVWVSDIKTLDDTFQMIGEISSLVNRKKEGEKMMKDILITFNRLETESSEKISCAYLIWKEPLMTVGGDTFISHLLNRAGFKNVFEKNKRYPVIQEDDILNKKPAVIFLSSEPYPFKETDIGKFEDVFSTTMVLKADGQMFSWYGSRLLKAPLYFLKLRAKIQSAL